MPYISSRELFRNKHRTHTSVQRFLEHFVAFGHTIMRSPAQRFSRSGARKDYADRPIGRPAAHSRDCGSAVRINYARRPTKRILPYSANQTPADRSARRRSSRAEGLENTGPRFLGTECASSRKCAISSLPSPLQTSCVLSRYIEVIWGIASISRSAISCSSLRMPSSTGTIWLSPRSSAAVIKDV